MSVRVISWVWERSRAEGTDRLVLLAIADSANDDGGNAWPSVATLAGKAKVSERTVQRSIRALVLLGEVSVDQNAGWHGTNVYTVRTDPRLDDTPDSPSPRQSARATRGARKGDRDDTRTVKNRPSTPIAPAGAGHGGSRKRAHCPRHVRYFAACGECQRLEHPPPPKPTWCGDCDETTRLAEFDTDSPRRCTACHPLEVEAAS